MTSDLNLITKILAVKYQCVDEQINSSFECLQKCTIYISIYDLISSKIFLFQRRIANWMNNSIMQYASSNNDLIWQTVFIII